jgi:aminoglycoside phosphotransferase (APT) family kinase protein
VIASGRDADILDLGGGRVLRRTRPPRRLTAEADLMRHVRAAGYPAPAVFEDREDGLVMARIEGPSMLDDLRSHPWRFRRHARTLAALHRDLHRIPAPEGLPAPFAEGDAMLHLDLHPANVLLSDDGPVVIDWSSAARGPAGADVADAWLVLAAARPDGGWLLRLVVGLLRGRFLAVFLREAGRAEAAAYLRAAAGRRAGDRNIAPAEQATMRRVAAENGV